MGLSQGTGAETLEHEGASYRLISAHTTLGADYRRWPVVLRLLAENVARRTVPAERPRMLEALRSWIFQHSSDEEIQFFPSRLLMHDTTSTPALVDMAAMRDNLAEAGVDPESLNPQLPVEVSVDHSLAVEAFGTPDAATFNIQLEIRRNQKRYRFLKWAASAMDNIHINPPGTGIMHTINLEQLATVATTETRDGVSWVMPDMMLGTDSHTPMINGLGVLGWGVGGLEAETVMFGLPTTLKIPEVVGVRLSGSLRPGVLATDLALVVTQKLREIGVTGEFVEFYGPGVSELTVGDRSVIANMAPEYGATTGFFPVDEAVIDYLAMTGRSTSQQELARSYFQQAGYWFDPEIEPEFSRSISIDLTALSAGAAGPRRPQDRLALGEIPESLKAQSGASRRHELSLSDGPELPEFPVALASITSCTNTSDPRLLITAGLLARKSRELGLTPAPWVKTSLAPGSPAAVSYLSRAGLSEDLSSVGFDIVGFGCATCIGNSGPLPAEIEAARLAETSRPVAILSGNRNFPGRVHPDLEFGFLMSPPLVVAYALAGDATVNLDKDPVATTPNGRGIYLSELWPSTEEIDEAMAEAIDPEDFRRDFQAASRNTLWEKLDAPSGALFPWDPESTILRPPPFAVAPGTTLLGKFSAHPLVVVGDDITTDHISPASAIPAESFIADFLVERGEDRGDLNVFASHRGNWEVMARGGFYAKSVRNELAPDAGIAMTTHGPSGETMRIWDAAERYRSEGLPVVVIAGDRYGMGSSRDWAAKVQQLLGVRAVLASSFERIHRSNLIGMGILPLVVPEDFRTRLHSVSANCEITVDADPDLLAPRVDIRVAIRDGDQYWEFLAHAGIETGMDVDLLRAGGVIPSILNSALIS